MEHRVLDIAPNAVMLRAEWMYDYYLKKSNYFMGILNATDSVCYSSQQFRGITYVKEVAMVVKKEMSLESPDTVVKMIFDPSDTIDKVYEILNEKIENYRNHPNNSFDKLAKILNFIPGLLLRWTIRFLRFLDYFSLLPRGLTKLSPFHASFFITSMGSLGIPPIVHHLYDFGSLPVFCSFGSRQREYSLNADGSVSKVSYVDVTYNLDERICDGFYYASALKLMKGYFKKPEVLDSAPEKIYEDIK